ncbi:MAG: ferrous iron transport protein B [Bacteroidales bacterium]|jgi:ferrous iron transport protein B|nr:ferrous iron transport protein B [Bacteroidales bacterium]
MTLLDLKAGDIALIERVRGRGAFRTRIVEMGFVKGREVRLVRYAPLKDPIDFLVLNSEVSLRGEEAKLIDVVIKGSKESYGKIDVEKKFTPTENRPDINRRSYKTPSAKLKICMVGNPNSGKTSLYNAITGEFEHVGNYGGVTVDSKTMSFQFQNIDIQLTDLPGTYSLSAISPEERFVQITLLEQKPDIIINVVDATHLERNLYLTTQLIDMDQRVVLALNMSDELDKLGDKLNDQLLSELLGMPIVRTVAHNKQGIEELIQTVVKSFNEEEKISRHIHITYDNNCEKAIRKIQTEVLKIKNLNPNLSSRFLAIKFLEHDTEFIEKLLIVDDVAPLNAVAEEERVQLRHIYNDEPPHILSEQRYAFIDGALKETYTINHINRDKKHSFNNKIDRILTHKILGFPIFLGILFIMFSTTFILGKLPTDGLQKVVRWLIEDFLPNQIPDTWSIAKPLLIDGVVQGIGAVVVFLPNILLLFFFISLMEGSGYMARVAFIMDKLMHSLGLHGKSFIPFVIAFGCNVPAIMATRTIENRKDRIVTMLILPFIPCFSRYMIFSTLITTVIIGSNVFYGGLLMFGIYLFGMLVAILSALFFHKVLLRHTETPFVMEMPPYRIPTAKYIFHTLWLKSKQFLQKMGGVILLASMVIWFLQYFPDPNHAIDKSFLASIGQFIEPIFRPLGFDWKMVIALLAGIPAKEVVASTIDILSINFTPLSALSFIVFTLLYIPCIAVIVAVKKESKSWKWASFLTFYTISVAYLFSLIVFQIGSLLQ